MSRPVPTPADPARARSPDASAQEIAALQNLARDWLLYWSRWRRAFTAIARFGPTPLIIDDPDPVRLLQRCRAVELAAAYGPGAVNA